MDYQHVLELAPSEELIHASRKDGLPFDGCAEQLRVQCDQREIPTKSTFDHAPRLCSETDSSTRHWLIATQYLAENNAPDEKMSEDDSSGA